MSLKMKNSVKETFKRISDSFLAIKQIRKIFLTKVARRDARRIRLVTLSSTIILIIIPWIFGELINKSITHNVPLTGALLGMIIALMIVQFRANLSENLRREKLGGEILPEVDKTIATKFSQKNIKQLRTDKKLSVGNIIQARGYTNAIIGDMWFSIEATIFNLIIGYLATIIGAIVFNVPLIAILATLGLIIYFFLAAYLNTKVVTETEPLDKKFRDYEQSWQEVIQKLSDFKAQGMQENIIDKNDQDFKNIFVDDRKFWYWYLKMSELREFILACFLIFFIYAIGVYTILHNPKTLPYIIALFSWGAIQVASLRGLAFLERSINKKIPAIFSFIEAFNMPALSEETGTLRFDKTEKFSITFDDVSHRFEDNLLVLSEINFTIKSGEKWAFIGESGSGKTTLINLILGSMPPTKGSIIITLEKTGQTFNLWDIDPNWWRSEVLGYVPQDVVLKDDTIRNNLLLAIPKSHPVPDDAKLMEIMHKFSAIIKTNSSAKPLLDVQVGRDGGVELSGGERQRIGIVRAVLKDARFIIFDEATSSLDAKTTNNITRAFRDALTPGITSIMIAHDLSTVAGGNPKKLLSSAGSNNNLVCDHYLILRPVTEIRLTTPQIDYAGSWQDLRKSDVLCDLVKESQKHEI